MLAVVLVTRFQSTLPRGSDYKIPDYYLKLFISIHAPSRERHQHPRSAQVCINFNPRSLAGATGNTIINGVEVDISIHAPSRERPDWHHVPSGV